MHSPVRAVVLTLALFLASCSCAGAEETVFEIPNPLGLDWPWELVHRDFPAGQGDVSVQLNGERRPAQWEDITVENQRRARLWFVATFPASGAKRNVLQVQVAPGPTPSPLEVRTEDQRLVVTNGLYEFRVPNFNATFPAPKTLKDLPPVLGGFRLKGEAEFYGKSWFASDVPVAGVVTEVVARGPVFAVIRVAYLLPGGDRKPLSRGFTTDFQPQDTWPPAGRTQFYEVYLRFVANDPWVDVWEEYHLPQKMEYFLELRENLQFDTVMWIRWFAHGSFGGNTDMHFSPLRPQEKQRGPFVALRPRWNQMPGGGQDFFVTHGGAPPAKARDGTETPGGPGYAPTNPAVGIVATYPMRWFNPGEQTIGCYAENGDTARIRFGSGSQSGMRAYAVCVGPRELFQNTGRLNSLVRRHTDWTLDKQFNEYILEWPRDPAKAGPHIFITREELKRLQDDFKAGKDTPEMAVVKEQADEYRKARETAAGSDRALADAARKKLSGRDADLLRLILGEKLPAVRPPSAELWLSRRYQDDYLNPTTATRNLAPGFAAADLACGGEALGGPAQAAVAYVFTDLNQWPGWHQGWHPGNPNFHTDKYAVAIYAAATLLDHPHARKWLDFGKANFDEDTGKVLIPPDGAGYECPGYSFYSLHLQLELARIFRNVGYGNPVAQNPLFRKTGLWHRHLLTPVDPKTQTRHQAPIGDTHRWGGAEGETFGALAKFHRESDPAFASEMMGLWKLYRDQGARGSFFNDLISLDLNIPPLPLDKMEWNSHAFHGFGAVLRSRFGTPKETFVSFKAGPATGHYHNDGLSYHFYGAGTPISCDYNCSYHPRGDHAALHNSLTFGRSAPFAYPDWKDDPATAGKSVDAMEQLYSAGRLGAFVTTPAADVAVAERSGTNLTLSPVYPEDARFAYSFPSRAVAPIIHRRFLTLVKHPAESALNDYLVVRDEIQSQETPQLNIHLYARDVQRDGNLLRARGQWDADAVVYLAQAEIEQYSVHRWYYFDENMSGPNERGSPTERTAWEHRIRETDGQALIVPEGWKDKWFAGEYQKWVRVRTAPKRPLVWVLYPLKRGEPEPRFETLEEGRGVRVTLAKDSDEVYAATVWPAGAKLPGAMWIVQNGKRTDLLGANALPPLGEMKDKR